MHRNLVLSVIGLFAVVLSGCAEEGSWPSQPTSTTSIAPLTNSGNAVGLIGVAGGSLLSGGQMLVVAPGALSQSVTLSLAIEVQNNTTVATIGPSSVTTSAGMELWFGAPEGWSSGVVLAEQFEEATSEWVEVDSTVDGAWVKVDPSQRTGRIVRVGFE